MFRCSTSRIFLTVFVLAVGLPVGCASKQSVPDEDAKTRRCKQVTVDRYDQRLRIAPKKHRLRGTSRIQLCVPEQAVTFYLHDRLEITSVTVDGETVEVQRTGGKLSGVASAVGRRVTVPGEFPRSVVLKVEYEGTLGEPEGQTGGISYGRVELAREAAWYPIFPAGGVFASRVAVDLPVGYGVISRGRRTARTETETGRRRVTWEDEGAGKELVVRAGSLLLGRKGLDTFAAWVRESFASASVYKRWESAASRGKRLRVTVLPFRDATDRPIAAAVPALTSKVETYLVNDAPVDVLSAAIHDNLFGKIKKKNPEAGGKTVLSRYGRQLGADYVILGRVDASETLAARSVAVTYRLRTRVLEVSSGEIVSKAETTVTKRVE